jgi:(2Fe-2S) ferredoxin
MPKFEKHIFICTNQRPEGHPRGSCDAAGREELQKSFKKKLAEHGIGHRVRANKAGCLDQCEHGPTVAIYPEAIWYGSVRESDVEEIVTSHILGGRPVERLIIRDECLNANQCPHKPRPSKLASGSSQDSARGN